MSNVILSNDETQIFNVPKWFKDYWKDVHTGQNRFAYLQAVSKGNRKNEPFPGNYNYKQSIECYVDYRAMPPQVKLVHNPNSETYCNYNVATCFGFLGRKDIERAVWEKPLGAIKLMDYLMTADGVKVSEHPPSYCNKGSLVKDGSVIIAGNYKQYHVAPIIGYGTDGRLYCANKGSNGRDGVRIVDGKNSDSAFYADMKDILFFEVRA